MKFFSVLFFILVACNFKNVKEIKATEKKVIQEISKLERSNSFEESKPLSKKNSVLHRNFYNSIDFKLVGNYTDLNFYGKLQFQNKGTSVSIPIVSSFPFISKAELNAAYHVNKKVNINKFENGFQGMFYIDDFNLDSLFDIAVLINVPMSGTASYSFYFQDTLGKFLSCKKFNELVCRIPFRKNYIRKQLELQTHYGCCTNVLTVISLKKGYKNPELFWEREFSD